MNKQSNMLTSAELFFVLIGSIIGVGILSLPSSVVAVSKQDGWISTAIGGIYPLYVFLVGSIIIKKYPESNILNLSKDLFGKLIANFLNFILGIQFIFYGLMAISGSSHTMRAYSLYFMPQYKIALVFILISLYISMKGLKVIAKLCIMTFYLLCIVLLSSLIIIRFASILNIKPIFGAGITKILKGSITTAYSYANIEFLLILYPVVKEKNKIFKISLLSIFVVMFIYTFTVFVSIYYAGSDLLPQQLWPFLLVTESVKIPVINNFRFIYIFIWLIMAFKLVSLDMFFSVKILNNITNINTKAISIFLALIIFGGTFFFPNAEVQNNILDKVMPVTTLFNISYVTLVSIFALIKGPKTIIKKGEKNTDEKV